MKAWSAYSAEVCHRHPGKRKPGQHIQQKCATDIQRIGGLASILGRSVPQTSRELKAWPAYSAVVCHRHSRKRKPGGAPGVSPRRWRNAQPWQRVHQRCRTDVRGICNVVSICTRRLSHTSLEYAALASLFTRGGADPSTFAACRRGCAAWHEPRRHKTLEDDRDGRMQRRRALLISDSGGLFGSKARQFAAVSQ